MWVDERLAQDAPQALAQFMAAYRRHGEGDPEALSQALTSCRRVLKSVADALYPATNVVIAGLDGRDRTMSDGRYVARLCQFASEALGQSTSGKLLLAQVKSLGDRLDALNALSSKGVHADVSPAEVDHCLMQTYLTVGDLLRIADRDSAAPAA